MDNILMPQLGETVAEGKVSTWFKQVGDKVEAGENLFEIETDKVTMEVQAMNAGTLTEIRVQEGETVPVGTVVAVVGDGSGAAAAPAAEPANKTEAAKEAETGAPADAPGKAEPARRPATNGAATNGAAPMEMRPFAETRTPERNFGSASANGLKVTPLARRLAEQNGVDLSALADRLKREGAWRIGRDEIMAEMEKGGGAQAPAARQQVRAPAPEPRRERPAAAPGEVTPFNNIRRQTGQRLTESWQSIPHVFQAQEIDFSGVDRVRKARKKEFADRHGVSLTYLPFIARAVCIAIADFPMVNARLEGDGLAVSSEIHLGIAVDLAHKGLVVPVIRNAEDLTVGGLARAIVRMSDKARLGKLTPDDYTGGTYSISNNGSFGTLFTTPIINPPQVGIISTDGVKKRAVVVEDEAGDSISIRPIGTLVHSFDHRAFDGAYSGSYLARLKQVLETQDWSSELS